MVHDLEIVILDWKFVLNQVSLIVNKLNPDENLLVT